MAGGSNNHKKRLFNIFKIVVIIFTVFIIASCPEPMTDDLLAEVEDTVGPRITITSPDLSTQYFIESTITIEGNIVDFSDTNGDIPGSIVSATYTDEYGYLDVNGDIIFDSNGDFIISFSGLTLTDTFKLIFTATDWNNNVSTFEMTLWVDDSGPFILIDNYDPLEDYYYSSLLAETYTITGQVGIDTSVLQYRIEWSEGANLPDTTIYPDASGYYSLDFLTSDYPLGSVNVVLTAKDSSLNPNYLVMPIIDDPDPPAITSSTLAWDNSYIDLTFSEPIYHTGGTIPLYTDFNVSLVPSSSPVTTVNIANLAGTPVAGATSLRLNISVDNTPDGNETIEINPVVNLLTDRVGNPIPITETSGVINLYDKTAPSVVRVSSTDADDSYYIEGNEIPITIEFSESVVVTTAPSLSLDTGGTAIYDAPNTSGSFVAFIYTVGSSQNASPLNYTSTGSLAGGIEDTAGFNAVLTLPDLITNFTFTLGAKNLVVDTTYPTILTTTLTSPDGGEAWAGGTVHAITWSSANITDSNLGGTPISLDYTTNGSTWNSIVSGEANDGTYSWTVPSIDSTTIKVRITATDLAGNFVSDSSDADFTIDSTPPATPTVDTLNTNDTTPAITGTASLVAGDSLSVTVNSITYPESGIDLTLTGSNWSLVIPGVNALSEGTYSVVATITDSVSNTANDASTDELVVDTTSPAIPTVASLTTNDTTPAITGTAIVGTGESLEVTVNSVSYPESGSDLTLIGSNWSLVIPGGDALSEATYSVTATITDSATNTSIDITSNELVVDTTDPTILTTTLTSPDGGEAWAGGTVHAITWSSANITDSNLGGTPISLDYTTNGSTWNSIVSGEANDGTYSWTVPSIDSTTIKVRITATDLAGNFVSDSSDADFTVDSTPPATPTVTSLTTSDTTPQISGTASVITGETLSVTVNSITYLESGSDLNRSGSNWTLIIPAGNELEIGTYEVTATKEDPVGNTADDLTSNELTIN